ncbi:MAG: hypothetical protein J6A44_02670 [Paludibacteraceae bacterium]|nr:hypothetical protein [Paludibacteraceae bacterium]
MAYNDNVIKVLCRGFNIDNQDRFTNCALVFAYNGTGKTRLSYDFAHYGRNEGDKQHTLYYNAYTEDLFIWDNDLENGTERRLLINQNSSLIQGLAGYDFTNKLRRYFQTYTDVDFRIEYDSNDEIPQYVVFSKTVKEQVELNGVWNEIETEVENIKISRGEERLFVWCFFRCILDQVVSGNEAYKDIEYIYIDDPMSSLDDNNVILFAQQLYDVIREQLKQEIEAQRAGREMRRIKFVVSTHHALFFHVMVHGLNGDKKLGRYYLSRNKQNNKLVLKYMDDNTPFYYNVAMMSEVKKAIENNELYTYHFTVLRSVMEKIKEFFGHRDFSVILRGITYRGETYEEPTFSDEELAEFYSRVVNVLTHQGSMFAPSKMNEDNKELAKAIFDHLLKKYDFKLPDLTDFRSESWIVNQQ